MPLTHVMSYYVRLVRALPQSLRAAARDRLPAACPERTRKKNKDPVRYSNLYCLRNCRGELRLRAQSSRQRRQLLELLLVVSGPARCKHHAKFTAHERQTRDGKDKNEPSHRLLGKLGERPNHEYTSRMTNDRATWVTIAACAFRTMWDDTAIGEDFG